MRTLRKAIVAVLPNAWTLRTTLSNGAIVLGKNRKGFGGRGAYVFRDALEPELEHLDSFLDAGDVVIDVGANTGVYSLKGAQQVGPTGTVVSLEPFVEVAQQLAKSATRNGFTNLRLRVACAAESTGVSTLWQNFGAPHSFSLERHDQQAAGLSVRCISIDDLVELEMLPRVDLVKIDAEGSETDVLKGAKHTIERWHPTLIFEVEIGVPEVPLAGYQLFRSPGSPNVVAVHESSSKLTSLAGLGWPKFTTADV